MKAIILNGLGFVSGSLYLFPQFFDPNPLLLNPESSAENLDSQGGEVAAASPEYPTPQEAELEQRQAKEQIFLEKEQERKAKEQALLEKEQAILERERLAQKLRELGIDPETI